MSWHARQMEYLEQTYGPGSYPANEFEASHPEPEDEELLEEPGPEPEPEPVDYKKVYAGRVFEEIVEEARVTKPAGMKMAEALETLVQDREERRLLDAYEAAEARRLAAAYEGGSR